MNRDSQQSKRRYNSRQNDDSTFRARRGLYKNPDKAKICGVCVGLAEYFQFETWVVRLIAFSFFLFSGGSAIIAYFVACLIMDPKPSTRSNKGCFGSEKRRHYQTHAEDKQYNPSVKDVWRKGGAPTETLSNLEEIFDNMENKLQSLESYVTSNQYQLAKEFENIK
ncbi:MAG: envelope stress response membrane protein PspC [Enterobacterales bacterium]|nr:envelope stress response membrane protein PspC [Enterobacterales bacterium]